MARERNPSGAGHHVFAELVGTAPVRGGVIAGVVEEEDSVRAKREEREEENDSAEGERKEEMVLLAGFCECEEG